MSDLIYLAVIVGFFAVAFGLLRACEHIIGPDTAAAAPSGTGTPADATTAPTESAEVTA